MSKWQKFFALLTLVGVVIFCFLLVINIQHGRNLAEKRSSPQGRLPDTVVPLGYDLKLHIDVQQADFSGVVKIAVQINKPVTEIWLHGKDIRAERVMLNTTGGSYPLSYKEMGHSGVVKLSAKQTILPQRASLEIHYRAPYGSKLTGLYKVTENQQGYIFSQFEPTGARKAFPGFDEPRFKVPFSLALEVRQSDKAFANTPQLNSENLGNGFKRLTFATTKPLPTYLLALAVGDFDVVTHQPIPASDIRPVALTLRGIALKGKGGQLNYALATTASLLHLLESYFEMPYPYEKLDLLAVPDLVGAGMEHPGLLTYREPLILLGDSPTFARQRRFAAIHAHELAHQWFGNLVTMPWWDDLWLNEAFATWLGNKVVHQWQPKFEFGRRLIRSGHRVMAEDALPSARKVREPVLHNDDIESSFNHITYQKGGALLQMFERFIGPETFRRGVQAHIRRFAFAHADADQFIGSMVQASGKTGLKAAFFSFLTQPGVPDIRLDWHCENDNIRITVKQSRYQPLGVQRSDRSLWQLPLCLTLIEAAGVPGKAAPEPLCAIIDQAEQTLETRGQCPVAIMPNSGGKGYYRFRYDQPHWQDLLGQLERLSAAEKYSLADNLAAAFRAGDVDANFYIRAIKPFIRQHDWDVITTPLDELQFIIDYIADPQEKEQLLAYLALLYRPLSQQLGLQANSAADKTDPVATSLLRRNIVEFMALRVKVPQLRQQLLALGKAYIGYRRNSGPDPSVINPDLATTAMKVAVEELGEAYFMALKAQMEGSNDSTFRRRALTALGAATDPVLAAEVRNMVLSLSIKNNERAYLIDSQLRKIENHAAIYDWMKSYFAVVTKVLPEHILAYTPLLAAGFCSEERARDVAGFFSGKVAHIAGAKHQLAKTLEQINRCIALKDHQGRLQFAEVGKVAL